MDTPIRPISTQHPYVLFSKNCLQLCEVAWSLGGRGGAEKLLRKIGIPIEFVHSLVVLYSH